MTDHVDTCIALARSDWHTLRARHGFSLRTGKTNRKAQRMRRCGAILLAMPALQSELTNETAKRVREGKRPLALREVLQRAEDAGAGQRFVY